ncbi:MAG: alpha/beta fold hydrolase [Chloroflexi bacterium]|nr:alpha/beta fold hydrolase [Chloroflexota bacterium]
MRLVNKPALVLLPGMLCDGRLWQHQLLQLAGVVDIQIGDLTRADSIKEMANLILADAPLRFSLAGLSLGGIVAFEILRQAPERVIRLVLLDTTPYPMVQERIQAWEPLLAETQHEQFAFNAAQKLMEMLHPNNSKDPTLFAVMQEMSRNVGPAGFRNQLQAQITRPDSRETLAKITCPTLVLAGREDHVCPLHLHREMVDMLPNAALVLIEQCGHLSSLEQPEAVTAGLRDWLQVGFD